MRKRDQGYKPDSSRSGQTVRPIPLTEQGRQIAEFVQAFQEGSEAKTSGDLVSRHSERRSDLTEAEFNAWFQLRAPFTDTDKMAALQWAKNHEDALRRDFPFFTVTPDTALPELFETAARGLIRHHGLYLSAKGGLAVNLSGDTATHICREVLARSDDWTTHEFIDAIKSQINDVVNRAMVGARDPLAGNTTFKTPPQVYGERNDKKLEEQDPELAQLKDVEQQEELHELRRVMKRAAELAQRFPDLLRDPEIDAAAGVIADARATASPAPTAIARDKAAPAFAAAARAGRATWSDEMKKTKAEGRRNPAQFIRDEYALELAAGILTRAALKDADFRLAEALAVWIHRHPEDRRLLPEMELVPGAKTRAHPLTGAERQARYRQKYLKVTSLS